MSNKMFVYVYSSDYQDFMINKVGTDEYKEKIIFAENPTDVQTSMIYEIWTHGHKFAEWNGTPTTGVTEERVRQIIMEYFDKNQNGEINTFDYWLPTT